MASHRVRFQGGKIWNPDIGFTRNTNALSLEGPRTGVPPPSKLELHLKEQKLHKEGFEKWMKQELGQRRAAKAAKGSEGSGGSSSSSSSSAPTQGGGGGGGGGKGEKGKGQGDIMVFGEDEQKPETGPERGTDTEWERGQRAADAKVKPYAEEMQRLLATAQLTTKYFHEVPSGFDGLRSAGGNASEDSESEEKKRLQVARVKAVATSHVQGGREVNADQLNAFLKAAGENTKGLGQVEDLFKLLKNATKELPEPWYAHVLRKGGYPRAPCSNNEERTQQEQLKFACRKQLCYGVPCLASLLCIREFAKDEGILEVGSGEGLWAALLQKVGACNVHATDKNPPTGGFCSVEVCDHKDAIERYGKKCQTLFLCWPFQDGMAAEAVERFSGKRVVYIGEGWDGCTGSVEFLELLGFAKERYHYYGKEGRKGWIPAKGGKGEGKAAGNAGEWRLMFQVQNPVWPGMYDACYMFERD